MKRMSQPGMLLLLLLVNGCGLGTEVGNGVKPKNDDGGGESAKGASEDTSSPDESKEAAPETGEGSDGGQDNDQGTTGEMKDGADDIPAVPDGYDINPSLLVAPCASPFAEDFGQNYLIQTAASADGVRNKFHVTRDGASAPWSINDGSDALMYTVEKNPAGGALAVTTKDSAGAAVDYGYTCTGVSTKTNVDVEDLAFKVTKKSVYVGNSALKAQVTWYFKAAVEPAKPELVRIEIDDADGEDDPVRLDVTPDSMP